MNVCKTLYGDTVVEGIPAWGNAQSELKAMGIEVDRVCVYPVCKKNYYAPDSRAVLHVYFMNKEGREVGYYTPCLSSLFVFGTPREVNPDLLAMAEYPN